MAIISGAGVCLGRILKSQGSAPAHESRFRRIRSPLATIRAWEFYERGNALSLTRRPWRFRRESAVRPRLAFARRKGSLHVLIRERIVTFYRHDTKRGKLLPDYYNNYNKVSHLDG